MARTKDFDEDEILNKAVSLFWHKGYNGTSMQELVDVLGISRSSLYDTYIDKHTLYVKSLEYYQNTVSGNLTSVVNNAPSAKDAVKCLLELTTNDLLKDKQHKGCFMVNAEVEVAPHDAQIKNIVRKNEQQIEDLFRQAIQRGQENGEITNKQDAKALARFFMNTVKGIRVSAKSTTDKAFFGDIISTALSLL